MYRAVLQGNNVAQVFMFIKPKRGVREVPLVSFVLVFTGARHAPRVHNTAPDTFV